MIKRVTLLAALKNTTVLDANQAIIKEEQIEKREYY